MIPLRRGDLKTWCQSCSVSVWTVHPSSNCSAYARFIGRHGTKRVPKAVLVSAVAPGLLKSDVNPQGVGLDVFDSFRDSMVKDRAQFLIDVPSGPSFGFNRDGATVSQGLIWNWYRQGMTAGFKAAYDCIKAFSETDTSEDIWNADIPILVLHGTDDQVVPIDATGRRSAKLAKKGTIKGIAGAPHALTTMCVDEVN